MNIFNLHETGFYKKGRKNGIPADKLSELLDNEYYFYLDKMPYPGGCFLHGICDVFATALHNMFGYEIREIRSEDDTIIHAFCTYAKDNRILYIDARGITSSYEDLISPFYRYVTDKSLLYKMLSFNNKKFYTKEEYDCFYKNAVQFISEHKEYYQI